MSTAEHDLEDALLKGPHSYHFAKQLIEAYKNEVLDSVNEELDFLYALEACGVDNWVGYDDSCSLLRAYQKTGEWKDC